MKFLLTRRSSSFVSLGVLAALIVASFGVDVIIENADACSYPDFSARCFEPDALGETSDAPFAPSLHMVEAYDSHHETGCGSRSDSCAGVEISRVHFAVTDDQYDDVDDIEALGLLVRTESDTEASREFLRELQPPRDSSCEGDGAVGIGYSTTGTLSRHFDFDTVTISYLTDRLTSSRSSDIRVSIAFVDQNGNIGPFSNSVRLRRRTAVF